MDSIVSGIVWGTKAQLLAHLNDTNRIEWWSRGYRDEENAKGVKRLRKFLEEGQK